MNLLSSTTLAALVYIVLYAQYVVCGVWNAHTNCLHCFGLSHNMAAFSQTEYDYTNLTKQQLVAKLCRQFIIFV